MEAGVRPAWVEELGYEDGDHRVEGGIWELEVIGVADLERDPVGEPQLLGAFPGVRHHVLGDVDPDDGASVPVRQVAGVSSGAAADGEYPAILVDLAELREAVDGRGSPDVEEGDIHVAHEVVVAQFLDLLDGKGFLRHEAHHARARTMVILIWF